MEINRRSFLKASAIAGGGMLVAPGALLACDDEQKKNFFKISLAQWSLHNALFSGKITNLDFPVYTKKNFDIEAVEYVSTFFMGTSTDYLNQLLTITRNEGVANVLIMVDGEGDLGNLYLPARIRAVERHYDWIDAAKFLGCHSIRVNARGDGKPEEVADAAVDGLGRLAEYGAKAGIGVIVENHGGYSSDAQWLTGVIKKVANPYCGTLPDFGNFCIKREKVNDVWACTEEYDRYKGTEELMPFAKGVSAKSHEFDEQGNETKTDYYKMLGIVKTAGYKGYIGIEYEGSKLSEDDGIMATKKLLLKAGESLK